MKQILAPIRAPINCRMLFYNDCYCFWGQRCCWTETSIIGNDFFVFVSFQCPQLFYCPPLPLQLCRRPYLSSQLSTFPTSRDTDGSYNCHWCKQSFLNVFNGSRFMHLQSAPPSVGVNQQLKEWTNCKWDGAEAEVAQLKDEVWIFGLVLSTKHDHLNGNRWQAQA